MSYILDALRRSQEEHRKAGVSPPFPLSRVLPEPVRRSRRGRIALTLAVSGLLVAIPGWLWGPSTVPAPLTAPAGPAEAPPGAIRAPPPAPPPVAPLGASPGASLAKAPPSRPAQAPSRAQDGLGEIRPPARSPAPPEVAAAPDLDQLPPDFQQRLPPLAVNVHVYAPEEAGRVVFINNRQVQRGEAVGGGVWLQEITPEGVILRAGGQSFRLHRPK